MGIADPDARAQLRAAFRYDPRPVQHIGYRDDHVIALPAHHAHGLGAQAALIARDQNRAIGTNGSGGDQRHIRQGGLVDLDGDEIAGAHRDALGRHYTYYTADELHALLTDAGFARFSSHTGTDKGLAGTMDPWITIAAHG